MKRNNETDDDDDEDMDMNDTSSCSASSTPRRIFLERRNTIPIELDFPEDCTAVGTEYDDTADIPAKQNHFHRLPKEARNILAGGVAGIMAKSVVAPVDRIKIMYQISNARFHLFDVPSVARKIVQSDGLTGLWKGNTAAMIRVFPYSGIQFMVFDACKQYFIDQRGSISESIAAENATRKGGLLPAESLVAGMLAGSVSVLCTYPLDLTRAQLAVLKKTAKPQSFVSVFWENYQCRGLAGLFRGIIPTLVGILPYSGIAFALNEQGKRQVRCSFHTLHSDRSI